MVRTSRSSRSAGRRRGRSPALGDVVEQAVDGEVAAARVLLGGAEDVVAADEQVSPPVAVPLPSSPSSSGAALDRSRGLARKVAVSMIFWPKKTWARRKRRPMMRQLRNRRAPRRGGAGGDVEVLGLALQEQVAHAAADQVGLVAMAVQPEDDLERVRVELAGVNLRGLAGAAVVVGRRARARRRQARGPAPSGGQRARGGVRVRSAAADPRGPPAGPALRSSVVPRSPPQGPSGHSRKRPPRARCRAQVLEVRPRAAFQ